MGRAVVGAALALKPLLVPVVLLFLFARRWRAPAAMFLVPALASGGAALLVPDPAAFVTRTLPFLLRGHDGFVRLYEASPAAVLPRLGVPSPVAVPPACAGACAGVPAAYRRWSRGVPGPPRLAETVLLMLSAFLVSRRSFRDCFTLCVMTASVALPRHRHLPLAGPDHFVAQRRGRRATRV
nr:glycosyltransferase 87 family protein [Streptomyces sp. NBC_00328]